MITLNTPNTTLAAQLGHDVFQLERRQERDQAALLKGTISPADLAAHTADLDHARARHAAITALADTERAAAPDAKTLAGVIAEFNADPALSVDTISDAYTALTNAAAALERATQNRNAAITGWVERLHTLGIPDTGLDMDGDTIEILAGGTIIMGGSRVSQTVHPANYIAGAVDGWVRDAHQPITADSLTDYDQRDNAADEYAEIRLTKAAGGKEAGDTITSRDIQPGAMARLVSTGFAELITGTLPDDDTRPTSFGLPGLGNQQPGD